MECAEVTTNGSNFYSKASCKGSEGFGPLKGGCFHAPGSCMPPVSAAAKNLEAEPHPKNVVFACQKASFWQCFDFLKGGVRDTRYSEPVYQ